MLGEDWDHQTSHQDLLLETLQSWKQKIAEVESFVVVVAGMLVVAEGIAEIAVAVFAAVLAAALTAVLAALFAAVLLEHFPG